jgi:modulator of FtsH protease HflC
MRGFLAALVVLLGGAAVVAYLSFYIVQQQEQAIVLQFGRPVRVVTEPGLYFKTPFVQTVETLDKRILELDTAPQEVTASDQKRLVVDAFTRYRITDPLKYYQSIRTDQRLRVTLGPVVESALRRALGSVTLVDVVRDKRQELMGQIAKQVNDEAKDFGIEIVDVRIKRAELPVETSRSVYARMTAERQREAQEFRAQGTAEANRIRAEADRQALIIRATAQQKADELRGEGDAERNRIFADAYKQNPEFFAFYRSMQAYEQGFKPGDTRLLLSPDSEFFRYFQNPSGAPQPKRQ